ncbi:hypothetical protein ACFY2M_45050 [Streptomyces sp. NPDC001276]|uniref:hypothetical protein n=1 Tax=Streptomyces sp. NPDC001276 TaxID=3364555 RepID=UPI0036B66574
MTVHISAEVALILITSCVTGFAIFKYSSHSHDGSPTRGDLGAAVMAAAAVASVLAVLMGVGSGDKLPARGTDPAPTATSARALR